MLGIRRFSELPGVGGPTSSPGGRCSRRAVSGRRPGGGSSRPSPRSSATSVTPTPSAKTPSRASGGPGWRTQTKAGRRRYRMAQARRLLDAPEGDSLQARRDRALLAVLLYHGLRRDEVARLTVGSLHEHRGVPHFRVRGKGSKTRPVPVHPAALSALGDYLELAGHRHDRNAPLFQPTQARWAGRSPVTASTS